MELDLEIREFLIESTEYMAVLDRDILALEDNPNDPELISSAFRAIHTIKGTCGFFGYDILGSITHLAESILSQVRERERPMTPQIVSLVLETLDAAKVLLQNIETRGVEGEDFTAPLRVKLEETAANVGAKEEKGNRHEEVPCKEAVALGSNAAFSAPVLTAPQDSSIEDLRSKWTDHVEELTVSEEGSVPAKSLAAHQVVEARPTPATSPEGPSVTVAPAISQLTTELEAPAREGGAGKVGSVSPESEGPGAVQAEPQEPSQDSTRETAKEAHLSDSTIRVDVALLNRLMNLVGELVLARNQLLQDAPKQNSSLQQTSQRLNLITSELQEGVMKTRMQPIGVVWNKLPRVVRDLAGKCGKQVRIEMEGAETELDKTIIEAIKDPLTHIVRNSCDHGIEAPELRKSKGKKVEGSLLLRAYHEGGVVNIEISDDGAGVDPQRVKAKAIEKGLIRADQAAQMSDRDATHLIFLPGFSTAAQITSVSGRGVGMDVVKTNIEKIGGSVEIMNRPEGGTTIRIKIPLTLAIIPGLVVGLETNGDVVEGRPQWKKEERFIIPQANLLELVRIEVPELKKRIENVHGTPVFHHRGKLLPLVYLGRVLGRAEAGQPTDAANIIVLQAENKQLGLVVDRISDTQEIVVKPLGRQLKGLSCYVGATIMGDGRPALILDVAGLARLAGLGNLGRQLTQAQAAASSATSKAQPQMMLLFRAGEFQRIAVPLALVDRLEEMSPSNIERSGGRPVLHYRDEILPLVSINDALGYEALRSASEEPLQIIVFSDGSRRIGLVVDQILDILNEPITVRRSTPGNGLLGSAVIGGKITDLLDLHALVKTTGQDWLAASIDSGAEKRRLLLIDKSFVAREILGDFLTVSGYEVHQAGTATEAVSRLKQQQKYDALLISTRSTDGDKMKLIEHLRSERGMGEVPVVELLDGPQQVGPDTPFSAQVVRSDCAELLETLSALTQATRGLEVSL